MSQSVRFYLLASTALMAAGSLLHNAVLLGGAEWYAFVGAPLGLIHMLALGSLRPAVSCIMIASILLICTAFALSAAGVIGRHPAIRPALAIIAVALIARGLLLPAVAVWAPRLLLGICGRCKELNDFVLLTSALCLFAGGGYAVAALAL